ncbi:MAG TPA: glutaredoxin domain-containing protein [Polyangiaceae bacterium]
MSRFVACLVGVVLGAAVASVPACKRHATVAAAGDAGSEVTAITVKPDSEGLLLTWIDDKGDFHVETRVADVPMMGKDTVRVVDPSKDEGTHADRIFVVDLRQARADGTFPVRAMTRADFEAIAVARREKNGPTLASANPAQASPSASVAAGQGGGAVAPSAEPAIIIYGAEWCGACHDAARYLKSKGIAFVEKDVEKDPAAAREMQAKLARNGLRSGSIPVIDVRGKVMVGFSAPAIENALGQAL